MLTRNRMALMMGAIALVSGSAASAQQLTFWTLTFSSAAANNLLSEVKREFEADHLGVDVRIVTRGTDEHKTALRVAAGASSGPDIFFSWAGPGLGGEYVRAGMSLPLDQYYEQYDWNSELLPAATAFADLYEGGRHGVPYTIKGQALYYSRPLFERAGIDREPDSYEALLAAAEKLKQAGIPAITFGGTVNWHLMRLMDVLLETQCGAETHDALMAMSASWAERPCATSSFNELKRWADNYILSPFMGIDQQQSFNLFLAGRAAMMLEGDWLVQQLDEDASLDDYGIFPFPAGTDRLYGFAEYNYISSNSEHPDLAAEFLDYLNTTEVQQRAAGILSTVSVNANVVYDDARPLDQKWRQLFADRDRVYLNGDQAFPAGVTTEYFRVINQVATGRMTPAQAASTMQAFIDNHG